MTAVGDGCARSQHSRRSQSRQIQVSTSQLQHHHCTSWESGRHYLEQELPSLADIQEHHLAHTDSITKAQFW